MFSLMLGSEGDEDRAGEPPRGLPAITEEPPLDRLVAVELPEELLEVGLGHRFLETKQSFLKVGAVNWVSPGGDGFIRKARLGWLGEIIFFVRNALAFWTFLKFDE